MARVGSGRWRPVPAAAWVRAVLLALGAGGGPRTAAGQRLRQYNLWVCPHCERGVKAADVTDLRCEGEASRSGGADWPWVKQGLNRFLYSLAPSSPPRNVEEVEKLLHLASAPIKGECYLGIVALGFFAFNFMDAEERQLFIRTTVFGGVTFQRAVPLSYWDVYTSGWPIFGLLAVAGEIVRRDLAEADAATNATEGVAGTGPAGGASGNGVEAEGKAEDSAGAGSVAAAAAADVGMTGIELGPRECCDFPGGTPNTEDQRFLLMLDDNLRGLEWVQGAGSMPLHLPLEYLALSAHRWCSWGRATAYFALAEGLLATPGGPSAAIWNSTQALVSLGERNLDGCEANTTVYHLMQSVWPFWHILGRLEQRQLPVQAMPRPIANGASAAYAAPPATPGSVRLKWRHLLRTRGLPPLEPVAAPAPLRPPPPPPPGDGGAHARKPPAAVAQQLGAAQPPSCLAAAPGLAHVALSADLKQIDGFIVTLHSSSVNAGENASRLCFHAFVLPHHRGFITEALKCAFGSALEALGPESVDGSEPEAFRLNGSSRLLLHPLDAARVRRGAGLPAEEGDGRRGVVMHGEVDLRQALDSDTGNLGAVHNFARFALHELLPGLPRVVYLDVDILVKGDLCELYETPLLSADGELGTIAAVRRTNQPLRVYVDVLQPTVPTWVPSEAPSFNAGVMVIDLMRWRERQASHLAAEWIALNARTRLWLHGSQPPLLLLFHDEVVPLHWTWNIDGLGHRLNYPKDVLRQAKVLHWTGPLKPWKHHGVNRLLWEPYALEYCPRYSFREHTTTCRPDSWFC